MEQKQLDSAKGSIIGAFIGDSLGGVVDLIGHLRPENLQKVLLMEGGGTFNLGPGQVTDDSQLAMCLTRGLLEGEGQFNLESIARYYHQWVLSGPFDIGFTVGTALRALEPNPQARYAIQAAKDYNQTSLSNGSLMRSTPLAVFCHKLSDLELATVCSLQASLTHSNRIIQEAQACYIKCISCLIQNGGDHLEAYKSTLEFSQSLCSRQIQKWFDDVENQPPMQTNQSIGYAKIAFDHAFRSLRENKGFFQSMKDILVLGGDADTNAAIVGGLVGAQVGLSGLPQQWIQKVLQFHGSLGVGITRPDFLDQREIERQIESLFMISPTQLIIKTEL